ncbi:MAG TPA: MerR family transcriptional regulator [Candidatus Dormibacteraeota bacterium]
MTGVYKIGVVSEKVGLSPSTLRLWEDQFGLLTPERSNGGTRLYSDAEVERVHQIRELHRDRGYSLEAIARILEEARQAAPWTPDRAAIENIYLRETANREQIEEGRRMADIHAVGVRLVRSQSARRAAEELVYGVATLGSAEIVTLGLYQRKPNTLTFVALARGNKTEVHHWPAQNVSNFPAPWQEAIRAREPYWCSDLLRLDLPDEVSTYMRQDPSRSFHAEPLSIGKELVGVLVLASRQPGGIAREARRVAARVAVAAGPAIHYFAPRL